MRKMIRDIFAITIVLFGNKDHGLMAYEPIYVLRKACSCNIWLNNVLKLPFQRVIESS